MRKFGAWGVTAALILGWAATQSWARDDDDPPPEVKRPPRPMIRWSPWAEKMFHVDEAKPADNPAPKPRTPAAKKTRAEKPAEPVKPKKVIDENAAARAREEAALMRRLEVCDKLKEIALRTGDAELLRRAELADDRARSTYSQHTAALRGVASGFETDDKTFAKYLAASKPARNALTDPAGHSTTEHTSQAAITEVNP